MRWRNFSAVLFESQGLVLYDTVSKSVKYKEEIEKKCELFTSCRNLAPGSRTISYDGRWEVAVRLFFVLDSSFWCHFEGKELFYTTLYQKII